MGEVFINLDLNHPPVTDPPPLSPPATTPPEFSLFLSNHETPRRPIEDRIRFAIRVSARQPSTSLMTSAIEPIVSEMNYKRDITHVAKALDMDVNGQKIDGYDDKRVLFDCNMCLGMAKDPVLTCCGHLFCWGCFFQVPYVDSVSKECPVCNGEVTDTSVVPVYGSGNGNGNGKDLPVESSYGVRVPPRPKARRVESVREESLFHNTVVDAVRRIRDGLAMMEDSSSSVVDSGVDIRSEGRRYGGDVEVGLSVTGARRRRRRRVRMMRAALARMF